MSNLSYYGNEASGEMDFFIFLFWRLNRSLLAASPLLSEFQAPVWSGKSIIVIKWALSKHPCGGTTPIPPHQPENEVGSEPWQHQSSGLDVHKLTAGGF